MNIDRVCFYVEDAAAWRDWFVFCMGFRSEGKTGTTEIVRNGGVCFHLAAPGSGEDEVARYLQQRAPGVADVAFRVANLEATLDRFVAAGGKVLRSPPTKLAGDRSERTAIVAGWGSLSHTLVERNSNRNIEAAAPYFTGIDHAVLNVDVGDLEKAVAFYERALGFERQQAFCIQTDRSGLRSQVLRHPDGNAQMPVNEPTSNSSQVREFLDANRGSGIQHLALAARSILDDVPALRDRGADFLHVPPTYYSAIAQRPGFAIAPQTWERIRQSGILVDWQPGDPHALLLQIFTQPIFDRPTFFFETIERQNHVEGFGEGNFQALFEAIEREQTKRGNLRV